MKLIFVGGALDHITQPISSAFYDLLGDDFSFVATKEKAGSRGDLGYGSLADKYPYAIKGYGQKEDIDNAIEKINASDVVIYGSAPESFVKKRMLDGKLTFRFTERLYKEPFSIKNYFHRLISGIKHHKIYQNKNVYVLGAGAYVANDLYKFGYYKNRYYKWGYFTKITDKTYEQLIDLKSQNKKVELIWVARFIKLKHPEMILSLAEFLLAKGIEFNITMVGGGEEFETVKKAVEDKKLSSVITLTGAITPDETRALMERADISLFTSDRREGWGAVVNESMGCACAVVASSSAGSSPFLVEDELNGLLFRVDSQDSFNQKVLNLINDREYLNKLALNAYNDIHEFWTPENASKSFVKLAKSIIEGKPVSIEKGPCSKALILKDGWYKK